ncbi:type III pantothenate kinase [Jiulongibacter sp. NS-SX5]|uniref:type III pantothenate kinase n=1 Tax=Jiulongibacter sp. NS-SX5 TaxID=3463854 RepID=UPI0040582506
MLVADIGNTDIVIGIFENDTLTHSFRIPSKRDESKVFFQMKLVDYLLENNLSPEKLGVKVLSSVVPELSPIIRDIFYEINKEDLFEVKPNLLPALKVDIENPEELGSDLYTNAAAAYFKSNSACIIVDFGTALTFTAVNSSGEIMGVSICPGLKTAINSLFSKTAQLPIVPLEIPKSAIGRNTIQSIQSGVLLGYEGLVKGLIENFKSEMNEDSVRVYATGGLSSILPGLKDVFDEIDIDLTLKGLHIIGSTLSTQ